MVKISKLILVLFANVILGCYPKTTKDGFRKSPYCFSNSNSILSQRIKLNGLYELKIDRTSSSFTKNEEKIIHNIVSKVRYIFYDNGIAILNYTPELDLTSGAFIASYYLKEDTIKMLYTNPPGGEVDFLIYMAFRITNDSTMEFLGSSSNKELDSIQIAKYKYANPDDMYGVGRHSNAIFIPTDSLPDQDILWIKRKSWFWCNEEEYKVWRQSLKKNK